MKVGVVAQMGNARAASLAAEIREEFREAGSVEVWLDEATADAVDEPGVAIGEMDECDLVVSIGGDGTFLFAARLVGGTPLIGVNLGEVGFLNAVPPSGAIDAVRAEVDQFERTGEIDHRVIDRLRASGDGDWSLPPAANEISVQGPQRGHGNGATLEVSVGGRVYTTGRADGVLVATPTGSTAYNLSEGGPLIHPTVSALVVTGMAAADPMPPLVVERDREITVRVRGAPHAVVTSDSAIQEVETPATVRVTRADEPVRLAGPPVDFFEALNKLD